MAIVNKEKQKIGQLISLGQDYFKSAMILQSEGQYRDTLPLLALVCEQIALAQKSLKPYQPKEKPVSSKPPKNNKKKKGLSFAEAMQILNKLASEARKNLLAFPKEKVGQAEEVLAVIEDTLYKTERLFHKAFPWKLADHVHPAIFRVLNAIGNFVFPKALRKAILSLCQKIIENKLVVYVIIGLVIVAWLGRVGYVQYVQTYHGPAVPGLYGVYYKTTNFILPYKFKVDESFDFGDWTGKDKYIAKNDNTSVRWTGLINVPVSGKYSFFINADDSARIIIDGQEVALLASWVGPGDDAAVEFKTNLDSGLKKIIIEYVQASGGRNLCIKWKCPGQNNLEILDSRCLKTI